MTVPPDHFGFDLVPNNDKNPKRDAEATKAVKAAIIALAKQYGITVHEEPGAIEPDAKENLERAAKIEREVAPKLIDIARQSYKEEVIEEEQRPDGTIRRRVHRIIGARTKLSGSLGELQELVDKFTFGIGSGVEIACKAVNWVREKIPSRKR